MLCPFCGNEMENGFLQSGGPMLVWVKKKHYVSLLPKEGEVLLDKNYLTGGIAPSWICKGCRKIITEYTDQYENEF